MKIKNLLMLIMLCAPLNARMLDVMIFTGMGEEDKGPTCEEFIYALCQKSRPIVVSSDIVNLALALPKYFFYREDDEENEAKFPSSIKDMIKDGEWDIYSRQNKCFLFIPKSYIKNLDAQFNTAQFKLAAQRENYTPEEILLGFSLKTCIKVGLNQLAKSGVTPTAGDFIAMFAQGQGDVFGIWNIYLTGHGGYSEEVDIASKTVQQIDVTNAYIADFTIPEFRELVQFFTKKIKVNFFYYSSCYAGDYNLILPYITALLNERGNILGDIKKPNFTIVAGATTSQAIVTNTVTALKVCVVGLPSKEKVISFDAFFTLLHKYGDESSNKAVLYKDQDLKKILLEITYRTTSLKDPYGISALPQVMFPGTDIFRAMALTDAISVITEVATRQHVFENKPFEFVDKEAILLYPNNIPVDISITVQAGKAAPAIVSMQPGASLISLENVTGNFTFSQFMKESFGATQPLFTKYYYIKTLTLKNDKYCIDSVPVGTNITLQNVIIKQQNEKRDIIFSYNNAAYFNNIVQARTASYEPELNREPSNKQIFDLVHKDIGLLYALDNYFLGSENAFDQILQRSFYRNYQDLLLLLTEQEQKTLMDPNLKKAWLGKAQPPPVSKQLKDAIIANDIKTARYLVDVKKIELSDAEIAELEKTPAYAKILDELGLLVPPPPPLAEDEDQVPPPPAEELVVPQAPALQPTMAPVVQPKKEIEKRRLKSMGRL